jgi:hypothetical protein
MKAALPVPASAEQLAAAGEVNVVAIKANAPHAIIDLTHVLIFVLPVCY